MQGGLPTPKHALMAAAISTKRLAIFAYGSLLFRPGFDYLEKYPDLIRGVTVEDVSRVARTYIDPASMTTVVVGPDK